MDNIDKLRIFFKVSNAAFQMQQTIAEAFGQDLPISYMHQLHKLALDETNKEKPDMKFINNLLFKMEKVAEKNDG